MSTTADPDTQRLHDAAEKLLAERLHAQGRAATDYTTAEYLDAVEEVTSVEGSRGLLEQVLEDMGEGKTIVDGAMLYDRAEEILQERGFNRFDDGGKGGAPREERLDALRQAIEEIGKPGEERHDLEKLQADRKNELAVLGTKAGVLNPGNVTAWMSRFDTDPTAATAELAARGVDVPGCTPRSPLRDPEYAKAAAAFITTREGGTALLPDEFSVRLHADAEELLATKGHRRSDGTLDYEAQQYSDAVHEVLDARTLAETTRLLEEQGLIVNGQKRYEQSQWSFAHNEAKATVRRQMIAREIR